MSQQDSLCQKCGLISWSGHRCAAILEREEHMNPQPKALRLADVLAEEGDSWWDDQAAAELRRLHAVNQELLEALWGMVTSFHAVEYMEEHMQQSAARARAAIVKATVEALEKQHNWMIERIEAKLKEKNT